MRAAVVELAFRGLRAERAESSWLEGNDASRRVSEKLGYRAVGATRQSPRGEPVSTTIVAVARAGWRCPRGGRDRGPEPCESLFGVREGS